MAKRRRIIETLRWSWVSRETRGRYGKGKATVMDRIKRDVRLECGHTTRVGERARFGLCKKCEEDMPNGS